MGDYLLARDDHPHCRDSACRVVVNQMLASKRGAPRPCFANLPFKSGLLIDVLKFCALARIMPGIYNLKAKTGIKLLNRGVNQKIMRILF